jgi:DMSO reductase family type II enzyme molybdopterin subunit
VDILGNPISEVPVPNVSRRQFLQGSAAVAVALSLERPAWAASPPSAAPPTYGDWRDVYRERWRWDRVVRGTHTNANCVSSCAWNLYVRDGIVWREEQSAPYAPSNASVPDWNPRGCQKGASCSDLTLSTSRIRHPLRRVGERGSGRWKRITWDEALGEIAGPLVDVLARRGGEGIVCELGPNVDFGPNTAAATRFFGQIGAPLTDSMAQIGDLAVGGTITLGTPHTDGTSDDWFRSDYLVLWAFNPMATRIPDAHYVNEARYGGARVVTIAPDYNPSSIHSDMWLSVRPGTDAALALAACQVVVEERLYPVDYLVEQTDLPFLVRSDTGRFLRESDVVEDGRDDRFAIWDEAGATIFWAPGTAGSEERTLALPEGVRPALDTSAEAQLAAGETIELRTVFSLLRERLERLRPERAADITGVSAATIRRFARDFAGARAALILGQWGTCKNYHSDLIQRSQILLASLTGNLGRAGGGWRSGAFIALDGFALVGMQESLGLLDLAWTMARSFIDPDSLVHEYESMFIPSTIFHAVHGGLGAVEGAPEHGDPALPRGAAPYLEESLQKKHFPVSPPPDSPPPEILFSFCGNVLRHSRMGQRVRDSLFAQARLLVDVNFRVSETGRNCDILLPSAAWYEKIGIKYIAAFVPYVTLADKGAEPLGEAKPEWEIFSLLARRVAEEAQRRNVTEVRGFRGQTCDIARLGERFSDDGRYGPDAQEELTSFILTVSGASRGIGLDDLRREGGAMRIRSLGPPGGTAGIYSEYAEDEPVVPLRDFVEKKQPYPTLTGRQQFYVDHPWFLELGEALPTHKDPPAAGGDHPFTLTGAHARWSIHAMWRDQELMLRMQRGEPIVYLNTEDCRRKGIGDNDLVRVYNDLGSFEARAKVTGAIRPGQVNIHHAWEPYQFRSEMSHQDIAPSPLKVTQLVGDYGHLHWAYAHYEPNQTDRDTRVDVVRLPDGA